MNRHVLLLYLATWALVAISPGPAVMCAMTLATRYGFRQALMGIAGIQLGHFVFFGCVASGLAALLATASMAFLVIRIIGALYLLYLGIRILAATVRPRPNATTAVLAPGGRSLLLQGLAIQVTNPKALLFMSALLPQFIQPDHALLPQLVVLLVVTIAVDVLVLSSYAYFALRGAQSLRDSGVTVWLERAFGAALIAFGLKLFSATRQ